MTERKLKAAIIGPKSVAALYGAAGVAVVSAFSRTGRPAEAAREFIRAMRTVP